VRIVALRRDGQDRKDALLDAALACFAKRGVVHTGIEEIRKAAGASPSSVYHLFGGLPDLTLALLERTFRRLFEHLSARVLQQTSAEKAIKALVVGHVDWVLAHRGEARFMYEATALEMDPAAGAALQKKKAEMIAPMAACFAAFMKRGELYRMSPLELDVIVLGSTHEACRRFLAGAPIDPRFLRRVLPVLAWQAVQKSPRKAVRRS
jgi:AcrR family transcriptional regulator